MKILVEEQAFKKVVAPIIEGVQGGWLKISANSKDELVSFKVWDNRYAIQSFLLAGRGCQIIEAGAGHIKNSEEWWRLLTGINGVIKIWKTDEMVEFAIDGFAAEHANGQVVLAKPQMPEPEINIVSPWVTMEYKHLRAIAQMFSKGGKVIITNSKVMWICENVIGVYSFPRLSELNRRVLMFEARALRPFVALPAEEVDFSVRDPKVVNWSCGLIAGQIPMVDVPVAPEVVRLKSSNNNLEFKVEINHLLRAVRWLGNIESVIKIKATPKEVKFFGGHSPEMGLVYSAPGEAKESWEFDVRGNVLLKIMEGVMSIGCTGFVGLGFSGAENYLEIKVTLPWGLYRDDAVCRFFIQPYCYYDVKKGADGRV